MKNITILLGLCLMFVLTLSTTHATVYTSTATGNWSTQVWSPAGTPGASDDVIIADGHTVTIDITSVTINNLTIGQGTSGILRYSSSIVCTLTVNGDIILNTSAQFVRQGTGLAHSLFLYGNLTIGASATLNFCSGSTSYVGLNFIRTAVGDQVISSPGSPTIVTFGRIIVNRPNITDKVVCSVTFNFLAGNLSLQLLNGTFEQTAGTITGFGSSATNLWLDQPNGVFILSGNSSLNANSSIIGISGANGLVGKMIINTLGTINIGTANSAARLQVTGELEINNGTINIMGRFTNTGQTTISGGNINLDPQGTVGTLFANTSHVFEIGSVCTKFDMSGGTITIINPNKNSGTGQEVKLSTTATGVNFSGGSINLGNGLASLAGSVDGFEVNTHTVPLWDLLINNNSGTNRHVTLIDPDALVPRNLVVKNNITIAAGILNTNYGTGSNITLGGAFSNSGTFNPSSTATYRFNGFSAQITNILPSTVGNLILENSSGITITNPVTVSNMLTLSGNNNYMNLNNVSGYSGLTYSATVPQTTGAELPASITNFTINNGNGVSLGGSTSVSGNFTLTNGLLILGTNNLTLGSSAVINGGSSSSYVDVSGSGIFSRDIAADGSYAFPIGNGAYSPTQLTLAGATYNLASLAADVFNIKHPQNFSATDYLNRYWEITASGVTLGSYNADFIYDDGDVAGTEASILLGRYDGSQWGVVGTVDAGTNTLSGIGLTSFSDFTGGEGSALPVELFSFNYYISKNIIHLAWKTVSEKNSSKFEIQRRSENSDWIRIGEVVAAGNSNSTRIYRFDDRNLCGKYSYRLKMIDADGRYSFSNVIEAQIELPANYSISQNYPNPFNPSTRIDYQLPFDSKVTLELYEITGEKVTTLINSEQSAGYYTADVNSSVLNLASGIYIYRLSASNPTGQNFVQVKKLMLTK